MPQATAGRPPPPFDRALLAGPTLEAARALLGARLVRVGHPTAGDRIVGRIVEVEAYLGGDDRASHARMGPTPRNRPMFGPPGRAYVYLVYGMHRCINIVTEQEGRAAAVLIRAVEPLEGIPAMRRSRAATRTPATPRTPDHRLAAGPGLVAAAFGIGLDCNGLDLCDTASPLHLAAPGPIAHGQPADTVLAGPRVGIGQAGEPAVSAPWRLAIAGSPALSRPFA